MPPRAGAFSGWPNYVENYCGELVDAFEALTKSWGWEGLDQPEPGRSAEVEERGRRFTEAIELELMGSAVSWVEGWKGRDFDEAAAKWAEKARERGITPMMPPEDAKAKFLDALRRRQQAPRLGTVIPKLRTLGDDEEAGDRGRLEIGLINLGKALVNIEGVSKESLTPWVPSPGDEQDPGTEAAMAASSHQGERLTPPIRPIARSGAVKLFGEDGAPKGSGKSRWAQYKGLSVEQKVDVGVSICKRECLNRRRRGITLNGVHRVTGVNRMAVSKRADLIRIIRDADREVKAQMNGRPHQG
jgi:hypothetical protein